MIPVVLAPRTFELGMTIFVLQDSQFVNDMSLSVFSMCLCFVGQCSILEVISQIGG